MEKQAIRTVTTRITPGDILGRWRMRWAMGRANYRVNPGLYSIGAPDPDSPVLVTANYKLTFDEVRSKLAGVAAWILVLDTKGINVWCAAGKGTFSTEELVRRVEAVNLGKVVSHRRLVVPQLGATGVAAHEVKRLCGFRVVYGPVRAADIRGFLEAHMRATEEMRRVTFNIGERFVLTGAELAPALKWGVLILLLLMILNLGGSVLERTGAILLSFAPIIAGVIAGTVVVPILLPWIPGHAFSLKGAIAGVPIVGGVVLLTSAAHDIGGNVQAFLIGTAVASFLAMQFTGSTTFTSPSGVEWEMKRALPWQIGAVIVAEVVAFAL